MLAEQVGKAYDFITQRHGVSGEAAAEEMKHLSEKLNDTRIEAKMFKSLKKYLRGSRGGRHIVYQGPGKIFATVGPGPRMNMRNRHNHVTNADGVPYVYVG